MCVHACVYRLDDFFETILKPVLYDYINFPGGEQKFQRD